MDQIAHHRRGIAGDILLSWILPAALILAIVGWLWRDVNWSFVRGLDFSVIATYRVALIEGLASTVLITFFSLALGLALGLAFACLLQAPFAPLRCSKLPQGRWKKTE